MHRNCTRADFEVCACTASSPHIRKKNSFHKLIHAIMRKIFVVQCHPRNIFNIELFLNYSISCLEFKIIRYLYTSTMWQSVQH